MVLTSIPFSSPVSYNIAKFFKNMAFYACFSGLDQYIINNRATESKY